ncbi:hypothetical protein LguiA_002115 [Lonicera macranthoides]
MGGEARKSVSFKAPAKDFYAGEFVGDQWVVLKQPVTDVMGTKADLSVLDCVDRVDDKDLDVEGCKDLLLGSGESSCVNILELTDELVKTKKENTKMRLYLDVLAEKMRVDDFPLLGGNVVKQGVVEPSGKNWADVVTPNRERSIRAGLSFIPLVVKEGMKCFCYATEYVKDEISIWKRAMIAYVLDVETPVEVIEDGPWSFDNRPLIIRPFIQKVEYEWIPIACKGCEIFRHTYANCPKKTKVSQHWVVKEKVIVIDCSAEGRIVARNISSVNVNDKPMQPVCGGKRTTGIESRTVVINSGNTDAVNMEADFNKESRHSTIEVGECSKATEVSLNQMNAFAILGGMADELELKGPDKGRKKKKGSPNGGGGRIRATKGPGTLLAMSEFFFSPRA